MSKTIIIKSFLNGIAGWLVFSLVFSLAHNDATFVNTLISYEGIMTGLTAFIGSFIGYRLREKRLGNRL
ncbi:MAG: hypothetical protein IJI10_09655 [Eubacterium sp.]|nr:hypothetical protein [Eubacterium sp.]